MAPSFGASGLVGSKLLERSSDVRDADERPRRARAALLHGCKVPISLIDQSWFRHAKWLGQRFSKTLGQNEIHEALLHPHPPEELMQAASGFSFAVYYVQFLPETA